MKRLVGAVLLCAVLCGCSFLDSEDAVRFYYVRSSYSYYNDAPVIIAEYRDIAVHRQDLQYLLSLYLMGPVGESAVCPFPKNTRLIGLSADGGKLTLDLTDTTRTLSDSAYSLACACISRTAMELTEVESVTVVSGSRSLTTERDGIMLTDGAADTEGEWK